MTEATEATEAPETEAPAVEVNVTDDRPEANRLAEATRKQAAAEKELGELRAWKEEQEAAKLTEQEKLTKERDDALAAAAAASDRATTLERGALVAEAARAAGFADPSDAVAFVTLADVEDAAAAKTAVKTLAEAKPHLLSQAKPQGFGTVGGNPTTPAAVPLGADGKPDMKAGLGVELMRGLLGGKG